MTEGTNPNGSSDGLQQLVRALGEAMYNDPGEKPLPMATADAEDVIRAQLTENTGTHFLDSGGAMGRHWEQNQENPPWEQPTFEAHSSYVTKNVYHHLTRCLDRDRTAVALEAGLYAYGRNGPGEGEAWLTCMEGFAESLLSGSLHRDDLADIGLPDEFIEDVLAAQAEMSTERNRAGPVNRATDPFTANTYNSEFYELSQVLQGTNFGGPYAEYAAIQVHQGADVRGGYTGPRVYRVSEMWYPGEFALSCNRCDWTAPESVVYDSDDLLYQSTLDEVELAAALDERAPDDVTQDDIDAAAVDAVDSAHGDDAWDGGVFHVADGCGGRVFFH